MPANDLRGDRFSSYRPITFPAAASIEVRLGDLMYDSGSGVAKPASSQADQLTPEANYGYFIRNWLGVAVSGRLSTDAATGEVEVDDSAIMDYPCSSSTFEIGDLLGPVEASNGTQLERQVLQKTTNPLFAVAVCVKRYGSATTTCRVRFFPRKLGDVGQRFGSRNQQKPGAGALADSAVTLTVDSARIQTGVPTAGRNVTLPAESLSDGLDFVIVNNSAGANSLTVKASDGSTTIGTVAQNKRSLFVCDGVAWVAITGA